MRAQLSALVLLIFWLKDTLNWFSEKKHKALWQIIEQGLGFNLNVNVIVFEKKRINLSKIILN